MLSRRTPYAQYIEFRNLRPEPVTSFAYAAHYGTAGE